MTLFVFVAYLPVIGWIVSIGLMFWIMGRLSLVFPAIAIDEVISFKVSWDLTRNYPLLMFLVVLIFPAMFIAPVVVLRLVPYGHVFTSLITAFATVFIVAALSVSYKLIRQEAIAK